MAAIHIPHAPSNQRATIDEDVQMVSEAGDEAPSGASVTSENLHNISREAAEIGKAEMEVTLRRFIMDLMNPTIRKTSHIEHTLSEQQALLRGIEDSLGSLHKMGQRVEEQVLLVDSFREEMARWDVERRAYQAAAMENMSAMKTDLDGFRYQLEREDSSIHSLQRTTDRVVGELAKIQEGNELLRTHVENRLSQMNRIVNSTKTDLEAKLVNLETRFNRAQDELWGEETGLAKVMSDLRITDKTVRELEDDVKDLQASKATVNQVAAVQSEVNTLLADANSTVAVLQRSVDTSLEDLKAHFKSATNAVAAHNAVMLQQVRQSYKEELDQAAQTRTDVMKFIEDTQRNMVELEATQRDQNRRTEESLRKMEEEVSEAAKARRRDKNNADVEVTNMREKLSSVHSTSQDVAKSLEHLASIIWMVVQSEGAASALDIQDDSDRGKVALMGYKTNKQAQAGRAAVKGKPPQQALAPSTGLLQGASNPQTPEDTAAGPVISVDQRCLSCSGHAQTVLSGFKMACLEYAPGPVAFANRVWKRGELLDWRNKLLCQARSALDHGPVELQQEQLGDSMNTNLMLTANPQKGRPWSATGTEAFNLTTAGGLGGKTAPAPIGQVEAPDIAGSLTDRSERPASSSSRGGIIKMPPLQHRVVKTR
mmetsp:Transcript_96014/g.200566  ORF Transcript_96014/g.200566 Transcript_96014/m.200566 type:complete len:654 (+) Transcript_96014:98-2059(+)|eukprot:CAMPEP_0206437244 /NCGR_PEP_ID=MMETSP0324_2-20121206/10934_1 /ASSEMBLY_ACC=CAM_ASM_000836 /TAXON_ID=2866 /ORGANISM="Crypthecodinium cohnii, Strain Seligo" /LENGTH=653 /DNA_ID=CAMNT_0053904505 /DNA_START=14 /DNA_END=1975 /DNA_ORIENTATION=+